MARLKIPGSTPGRLYIAKPKYSEKTSKKMSKHARAQIGHSFGAALASDYTTRTVTNHKGDSVGMQVAKIRGSEQAHAGFKDAASYHKEAHNALQLKGVQREVKKHIPYARVRRSAIGQTPIAEWGHGKNVKKARVVVPLKSNKIGTTKRVGKGKK